MVLPTAEQVGAIMTSADPALRASVAVGAFASLRLTEAAGLQVAHFDFV